MPRSQFGLESRRGPAVQLTLSTFYCHHIPTRANSNQPMQTRCMLLCHRKCVIRLGLYSPSLVSQSHIPLHPNTSDSTKRQSQNSNRLPQKSIPRPPTCRDQGAAGRGQPWTNLITVPGECKATLSPCELNSKPTYRTETQKAHTPVRIRSVYSNFKATIPTEAVTDAIENQTGSSIDTHNPSAQGRNPYPARTEPPALNYVHDSAKP